jgi:flavodoxin/ferredoxin
MMNTLIIYFSQTGGTLKVAECIRDGIVDMMGECDLVSMDKVDVEALADYDLVGLGCPVFYFQEPFNVRAFIDCLPQLTGKQWFLFCTHGSSWGNIFPLMTERLKEKGIIVVKYHHTYSDALPPNQPYPAMKSGHPNDQELEEARSFGRELITYSRRIAEGDEHLISLPELFLEDWVKISGVYIPKFLEREMPRLSIDMDKCNSCRDCEEICPVSGIDVEEDPPRIQRPCIYCWSCAKICPVQAIEADWEKRAAAFRDNYTRTAKPWTKQPNGENSAGV